MTSETLTAEPFLSGLFFGECPRWHDGRLWYSDFFDHAVFSVSPDGERRVEVDFDGEPGGPGLAPRRAAALQLPPRPRRSCARGARRDARRATATSDPGRPGTPTTWWWPPTARPTPATSASTSTASTTARSTPSAIAPASLVRVDPDGTSCEAAADLAFPNGTVITDDGATLIIAESIGGRLTAFDRAADGTLTNRREWAALPRRRPRRHLPVRRRLGVGGQRARRPSASGWPRAARSSSASSPP